MCNFEALDDIRLQVQILVSHTQELRNRFNDVDEEFREGNLGGDTLSELNQAIHNLELNAANFETLLEA